MKKTSIFSLLLCLVFCGTACTDMLLEESKTNITSNYLKTTPDGLSRMVVGLYDKDRTILREYGEDASGDIFCINHFDYATDIIVMRSGSGSNMARLQNLTASTNHFKNMWSHNYQIIGKANEVIYAAEHMDLDDPVTRKAWGEAKVFRARAYFELYKKYERLYINTVPTTVGNIERVFKPSGKEAIFTLIKDDLSDAIGVLDWVDQPGRWTQAVARHIRAQVAMWEDDWTEAITQCEEIFKNPNYGMMENAIDCFNGADLNCKENLYVYQYSSNIGGGGKESEGEIQGHRLSLITTVAYQKIAGTVMSVEYGGYGWGRVFPNAYLLSLYDKEKDKRYENMFRREWKYNDPSNQKFGQVITPTPGKGDAYIEQLHTMSLKYADSFTRLDNIEARFSFKDVVVYRLAETYLMAAEAYYHRDGGNSAKALEYYNKTWERAGNDRYEGPLTIDILLEEYARELHMEGVRWPLLKRLRMLERVTLHGGETPEEDPNLAGATNVALQRTNFQPKHYVWPIPQSEVDFMGAQNFPQNKDWL